MYQSEQFMKHAGEYLKVKFDIKLIEQVKKSKEDLARSQDELSISSVDDVGLSEQVKVVIDPVASSNIGTSENSLSPETKKVDDNQVEGGSK